MLVVVAIRIDSRTTIAPIVLVVVVAVVDIVHSIIAVNTATTTDVTTMVAISTVEEEEEEEEQEVVFDQTTKGFNSNSPLTEVEDVVEEVDDDNTHASLSMKISKWVNLSICKFLVVFIYAYSLASILHVVCNKLAICQIDITLRLVLLVL